MTTKPQRFDSPAPSDAECAAAWDRITKIASEHCLILDAYGGVMTLAMPQDQRKAGVRARVLAAHERDEAR